MRKALIALTALALTAACSGLKTYSSEAPKNLRVATQLDRGVRTVLHVHEVTGKCETHYDGTVTLDQPTVEVGVPAGRASFLVVSFDTSSFLGGQRGTSIGTALTPRAGYRYELAVRYRQDMYEVGLREIDGKGVARELPRRGLGC